MMNNFAARLVGSSLLVSACLAAGCKGDDTNGSGTTDSATGSGSTGTGSSSGSTGSTGSGGGTGTASAGSSTSESSSGTSGSSSSGGGATCSDGMLNGDESDVDCGGSCPDKCAPGGMCNLADDCDSGVCTGGMCAMPACDDQVMNGDETDLDCGGSCVTKCDDQQMCAVNGDCTSDFCDAGICKPATCVNGVKDVLETDVDCGGGQCSPCPDGDMCGNGSDCVSGVCDGMTMTCSAPACDDLVKNGDETDVDCGGPTCTADCDTGDMCSVNGDCISQVCDAGVCVGAGCMDLVKNGNETDVDCGGADCADCSDGSLCSAGSDCVSKVCNVTCQAPTCMDMELNGDETDLDCGGMCGATCMTGEACVDGMDCVSGVCDGGADACVAPGCNDNVENGDETDIDCGGMCGATCGTGEGCADAGDCVSGVCDMMAMQCAAPACDDLVQNGTETDVDCGGSCMTKCGDGDSCANGSDCQSGVCTNDQCAVPSCSDAVQNGTEEGIDCAGPCANPCKLGGEVVVNTTTTGFQLYPAVAAAPDGSAFVVVWTDNSGADGSGNGVYGQVFDGAGTKIGSEFLVNSFTAGAQQRPTVAAANSGFVVAWESAAQDGSMNGVYAQRYNWTPTKQGGEFAVNTITNDIQDRAAAAMDSAGNFVVCFESNLADGANYGVYCRRFNSGGTALDGADVLINSTTLNNQRLPRVGMAANGVYTVVWQADGDQDGDLIGVYMRRYNAGGVAQTGEVKVNTTTTGNQQAPTIGMNDSGAFVITWTSPDANGLGVFGQRYDAAGATQGGQFQANTYTSSAQTNPAAMMNSAGHYALAWQSDNQDASLTEIYAQRYTSAGSAKSGEFRVNTVISSDQDTPAIAAVDADAFVVVWENGQTNSDIKLQLVSGDF